MKTKYFTEGYHEKARAHLSLSHAQLTSSVRERYERFPAVTALLLRGEL